MPASRDQVICPYCQKPAGLVMGRAVYPHRPDLASKFFWKCNPCDAYVGTHSNSPNHAPLGTLANAALRRLRTEAHYAFDQLWRAEDNGRMSRSAAYAWLQDTLGLTPAEAHIGRFNEEQCQRLISAARIRLAEIAIAGVDARRLGGYTVARVPLSSLADPLVNVYLSTPTRGDHSSGTEATETTARQDPIARTGSPAGEKRSETHRWLGGSRKRLWPSSW